jgi:arylsulfatase
MSSRISRRTFLKLLTLLSFTPFLDEQTHWAEETSKSSQSSPDQKVPNVLVLVFDALSAKHLSLYGYSRQTTPNLAKFAERATVYHAHYAAGNFTTPGTASLLTGTYPWSHRAFNLRGTVAEDRKHWSLFRAFAGKSYNRIAYTHNWLTDLLLDQLREDVDIHVRPSEFGLLSVSFFDRAFPNDADIASRIEYFLFSRGFPQAKFSGSLLFSLVREKLKVWMKGELVEEYASLYPRGVPEFVDLFFLLEHAIDGITALVSGSRQPFVGYFHLLPPHAPYSPRREFIGLFDDGWEPVAKEPHFFSEGHSNELLNRWRREYDEYVAYADAEFGRLYDFLERSGMLDNTYVVFTSDHGEMFERGIWEHQTPTLYEPIVRIPLFIAKPGQQQREDVYTPTSCVDLLPTLLHATGQAIPDWCEGEILPPFGSNEASMERSIFAVEAKSNSKRAPLTKATVTLIKGQYKLIHYFGYDGYEDEYELYDLANDPEEMEDLYSSNRAVAADLQRELEEKLREVNRPYVRE